VEAVSEQRCIGRIAHQWTLSIEEGKVTLTTEQCWEGCPAADSIGDSLDWLTMAPIPVHVNMATECPAFPVDDECVPTGPPERMKGYESGSHYIAHGTRCDCNWWPVVRPILTVPAR
jgi:hypothetical protein